MGEIGIQHETFLYELRHWQVRAIISGYRRRQQPAWEQARMNAYFIMSASANLAESGYHSDKDLIRFPWEEEEKVLPDEKDVDEVQKLIASVNKQKI